jgi:hypothetical protein
MLTNANLTVNGDDGGYTSIDNDNTVLRMLHFLRLLHVLVKLVFKSCIVTALFRTTLASDLIVLVGKRDYEDVWNAINSIDLS